MASQAATLSVNGPHGPRDMRISSPSRVLWPDLGLTKLDLARYITDVGDAFLAANGDRPVSLQRFPEGIDSEMFFSKNPPKGAPDFIRSVTVVYPSARSHPQLVLDEPAAAVWAVQMNTIVFHPWPSRAGTRTIRTSCGSTWIRSPAPALTKPSPRRWSSGPCWPRQA